MRRSRAPTEYQGSIYEFLRDESFDSKDYFAAAKGVYDQHNYGGSFGGPLRLPGYNGRDKTFFFATYEGFVNEVNTAANTLSVPTPEMWNGDFSNLVNASGTKLLIYDPATTRLNAAGTGYVRDPFSNNQIPVGRFSALARNYVAMARNEIVPNTGGTPGTFAYINNNYLAAAGTQKETTHKFSVKLDHALTSSQRFWQPVQPDDQPQPSGRLRSRRPASAVQWRHERRLRHERAPLFVGHVPRG